MEETGKTAPPATAGAEPEAVPRGEADAVGRPPAAWLPIPLLLLAILGLHASGATAASESRVFVLLLNVVFSMAAGLLVAALAAREFLVSGSPRALLLGCATLVWGGASVLALWVGGRDPNVMVTIHNSCAWLSAACHLTGVLLPPRVRLLERTTHVSLVSAYVATLGVMTGLVVLAQAQATPLFFVQGHGGTPLRQAVLASAIGMFSGAAAVLGLRQRSAPTAFAYWYTLALALIAVGLLGILLQPSVASAIGWVGRGAQALAGAYMIVAAVAAQRSTGALALALQVSLEEAEQRIQTLAELAPDAIIVHRDGRFVYANGAAARLYGVAAPEDLLGRLVLDHVGPEDRDTVRRRMQAVVHGQKTPLQGLHVLRLDGRTVPVETTASRVRYEGEPATLVILRDIGDRLAVEQERERALRELQRVTGELRQADRRKDEFLAALSHELRNPLSAVRNGLHVLERAEPGGDTARRALVIVQRQAGQLARLVDDLLDVTRITHGRLDLKRERLDLADLARRTVEDHRALFGESGARLELAVAAEPVPVEGDASRLSQVLGNLLHNAAKFTPSGGRVAVYVARDDSSARARLSVADSGIGMAPETLGRLFEPFAQAEVGLDRGGGGLGLGLALVRGIVRLHGGVVQAHSDGPGRGATFTIELPLARGLAEPPPSRAPVRSASRRVLVIEDNRDAAETLAEVLRIHGHQVRVALEGQGGLAAARSFRPDVVLCDIGLPGLSGYEVARACRADEDLRGACLVALSGYTQPTDVERALDAGFDAHLPKPPDIDALERVLGGLPRRDRG